MKRGSSLRFIEWPMPPTSALVLGVALPSLFVAMMIRSLALRLAQLGGGVLHRLDDVDVTGAAAEVAGDRLADLLLAGVLVLLEQRAAGYHHAGRAEAALQAVLLHEPLLDGVQLAVLLEPLDGLDLAPVGLDRQHGTGLDRRAVEQHRARAAVGGVAADVRAGQAEHLANQ